jgi:hypothetical protein
MIRLLLEGIPNFNYLRLKTQRRLAATITEFVAFQKAA